MKKKMFLAGFGIAIITCCVLFWRYILKAVAFVAAVVITTALMLSMLLYGYLARNPAKPEITCAEFPFTLIYEVNGVVYTVEDAYVCEYSGIEHRANGSKRREWSGHIKSTGDDHILLYQIKTDGYVSAEYSAYVGSAEYYMGDWGSRASTETCTSEELADKTLYYDPSTHDPLSLKLTRKDKLESGEFDTSYEFLTVEEIGENGIRILKWEYGKPIINSFERCRFIWF